ncbi:Tn3 family transposase [Streptomyces antimycoticus]|uniref:Tn3 family transposase n=1 Tax=Streptomyces antimycoticus TaxID=68175 RepID=UPI00369244EC
MITRSHQGARDHDESPEDEPAPSYRPEGNTGGNLTHPGRVPQISDRPPRRVAQAGGHGTQRRRPGEIGALITNQVRAHDLLRMSGREGHPTPLSTTFAEHARTDKTMHLLALADPADNTYQRLMNRQLTEQKSHHRLAPANATAAAASSTQAYHEDQENQLTTLGWSPTPSSSGTPTT